MKSQNIYMIIMAILTATALMFTPFRSVGQWIFALLFFLALFYFVLFIYRWMSR